MVTPVAPAQLLKILFDTAVTAAMPQHRIKAYLPPKPEGKVVVVGAGKSAAAMAKAVEAAWDGKLEGLVITRYGHHVATDQIEVVEAAHPVPDSNGVEAAQRIFDLVTPLTEDDLVLGLISGGGSSLFTLPPAGLTLTELADINRQLLQSGASITEMNAVRKNLSCSSGGRLAAAAYPAQVVSLIISDVPGDDLAVIASGPTVGDTVTAENARQVIQKYDIAVSPQVTEYLKDESNPVIHPDDPRLQKTENILIAAPQQSLEAAAQVARNYGYTPLILGDSIQGEAKDVGIVHAGIAQQTVHHHQPMAPPCIILSGGETTVTVKSSAGKGGRNSEFLLSLAIALDGLPGVYAIACDTDGIDGNGDNAGALLTPDVLAKSQAQGLPASQYLQAHDSYTFFAALDALVVTGPTLTNVNDFRAILVDPC
ncbi:MAG: glycerate kinase [Cyanothece sp. SIO1E1]|nr:glycerate kinase [Cyanothece sp. SIO1E1]